MSEHESAQETEHKGQRREVNYSGRVQGVGFRYTVNQIASRFPVTGYVQNLANGQVLLVVEGTETTLDEFLAAIYERMEKNIEQVRVERSVAVGEFDAFNIRF